MTDWTSTTAYRKVDRVTAPRLRTRWERFLDRLSHPFTTPR
jgi:hypothetical protein